MTDEPAAVVTTVGDGVAQVSWGPEVAAAGWLEAVGIVSGAVEQALSEHDRVETHINAGDEQAHRVATWSGLRREGVRRGVTEDAVVYARLRTDTPVHEPGGFRALLNSFLPRKRGISQMLIHNTEGEVLVCQLTYKQDWDLPGGVVEVGESPQLAVSREVEEELGLKIPAGDLLLTDWLPPWGGWDDALCLVFDGGTHPRTLSDQIVKQAREIRAAEWCSQDVWHERCADFTARRIDAAVAGTAPYTESGRPLP